MLFRVLQNKKNLIKFLINLLTQLCFIPKKKYDISDLVLKSILREDKLEKLNIEFNEDSLNPELEERKKLLEEKSTKG